MGVPSAATPPVGSVGVGQLLVDAQSRTIWYGVPGSIDPAQSLLVADIMGLMQEDDEHQAAAQAYTDSQLGLKSDVGHHHAIGDVDGLEEALDDASAALPTGCIVIWSGTLGTIPGGWALCNGDHGTPDLRDKFILGAGGSLGSALDTGGARIRNLTTAGAGGHTHAVTITGTAITIAQMPAHTHAVTDPGHNHPLSDPGHTHLVGGAGGAGGNVTLVAGTGRSPNVFNYPATSNVTGVSIGPATTGVTIVSQGGGQTHTHANTVSTAADHQHTIPAFDVMPPYIILGYIMRV